MFLFCFTYYGFQYFVWPWKHWWQPLSICLRKCSPYCPINHKSFLFHPRCRQCHWREVLLKMKNPSKSIPFTPTAGRSVLGPISEGAFNRLDTAGEKSLFNSNPNLPPRSTAPLFLEQSTPPGPRSSRREDLPGTDVRYSFVCVFFPEYICSP